MPATAPTMPPVWTTYSTRRRWGLLAILFLVSLSNYVDRHVMSVLIEPIKTEFRVSDAMMGALTGFAFAAFYAVLGIPVARLADRGNRRTVITVAVLVWSVMASLCGLANTFWQLALARFGVGAGEAGAIPPAQSLIADYFPPEQRSRALGAFIVSSTAGYLIAFTAGTQIAAHYGWRMAFVAMGLPGLALALITGFGLHEPRNLPGRAIGASAHEPLMATWRALVAKRSYVLINLSMILYFLVAYGALTWMPAYLGRVLGLKLTQIGAAYGAIFALGAVVGTLFGGILMDRLSRADLRQLARVPGLLLIVALPFYELCMWTNSFTWFLIYILVAGLCLSASVPAMFSLLHTVCGSSRRAMAVAISFFFANLFGLGFGPVLTGWISDRFTAVYGPQGLRYALMIAFLMLLPSGATLWQVGNSLVRDAED